MNKLVPLGRAPDSTKMISAIMAAKLVLSIALLLPRRFIVPVSSLSLAIMTTSGGASMSRAARRSGLLAQLPSSSSSSSSSSVVVVGGRGGAMPPSKATASDATASATAATKSTTSRSLASDYSIRIRSPPPRVVDELRWELLPLGRRGGRNPGVGTAALRALSDGDDGDGAAGENGESDYPDAVACALSCEWSRSRDVRSTAIVDPGRRAPRIIGDDGAPWSVRIRASAGGCDDGGVVVVPRELVCILARVMAQSAASEISSRLSEEGRGEGGGTTTRLLVTLPLLGGGEGCQELHLSDLVDTDNGMGVRRLFAQIDDDDDASRYSESELVDMVDREGRIMGSLPRPYVHAWNILHRGVGVIVTRDEGVFRSFGGGGGRRTPPPDVYVHRRTSTKRIFPSLYDMFVGGVSCRGEGSRTTAAREVAEELGLRRAMDCIVVEDEGRGGGGEATTTTTTTATATTTTGGWGGDNPLSDELFKCTVCTSYNRCVVTMFAYATRTGESVSWQEEEVAWGDYVPYDVVEMAADASVDRLVRRGDWPGSDDDDRAIDEIASAPAVSSTTREHDDDGESRWETWDFVPDGLLVWEAWKSYVRQR